jgi:hypothetical protein
MSLTNNEIVVVVDLPKQLPGIGSVELDVKVHSERAILYLQYYNVHPLDSRMFTMFSCV